MTIGQKNFQTFKDHLAQAYRRYQIRKKATAAFHVYGASENHANETDAHMMTSDALQSFANVTMKTRRKLKT